MKISGAQAIIKSLEAEKVNIIFGYPGAAICPFYDVLPGSGIRHVLSRHEQGAAHAASGYARATGKVGVCMSTSGPGATNLITGIATAYMDSIPLIAITGQVSTDLIGRDVFQEADITGATSPFCKHSYLVKKAEELPRIIKEAFHVASTGRPGPVVIDIPFDVQMKMIDFAYPETVDIKGYKPTYKGHVMQIRKAAEAVKKAKAPVICAGGGIISSDAAGELLALAEKCNIPVTTTLMGIGAFPSKHELCLGMLGSHGSAAANHAIHNADLLMLLGARVGDRAMSTTRDIAKKAKIIHIDIDPAEIGKNIDVGIPIVGDVKLVLRDMLENAEAGDTAVWVEKLKGIRDQHRNNINYEAGKGYTNPRKVLHELSRLVGEEAVFATDVGQNQIWAANNLDIEKPRHFITSGGMGTMGYGLPSAVGAKVGLPDTRVVAVSGDGGFQMAMQELGTIKQEKLDIKIILFNNTRLGMVRELQKAKYCGRYCQVYLENNPDFVKLVEAYGFEGRSISDNSQVAEALEWLLSTKGTSLLECLVDPEEPTL